MKNQKGITLVALVVTIIVLLILAGVSLSLVMGDNGILSRASNAGDSQKLANIQDQVELEAATAVSQWYEDRYVNQEIDLKEKAEYVYDRLKEKFDGDPNDSNVTLKEKKKADNVTTDFYYIEINFTNPNTGTTSANHTVSRYARIGVEGNLTWNTKFEKL